MASSVDDLERYLDRLGRRAERLDDNTLIIALGPSSLRVALLVAPPVVVAHVDICPCPAGDDPPVAHFLRRLLELNAAGLVHSAYGIEDDGTAGGRVTLGAALELDNLDPNELEALLADLDVALAEHVPELRRLVSETASASHSKGSL